MKRLKADINRYLEGKKGKMYITKIFDLLFKQGLWALVVYRFGFWCVRLRPRIIFIPLRIFYFFLNKIIEISTGISISARIKIGKGFYIGHFGGIIIHPDVEIGENCSIGQGVTIGTLGLGKTGAPKIGNNVFIGVGAKVLGNIIIGDNVRIGANAVVIEDVPENATAVGVPAKIVKINLGK